MDQSTIGQNLRPLQRDGLVTLERDEADRRSRLVKLTRGDGRALPMHGRSGLRRRRSLKTVLASVLPPSCETCWRTLQGTRRWFPSAPNCITRRHNP